MTLFTLKPFTCKCSSPSKTYCTKLRQNNVLMELLLYKYMQLHNIKLISKTVNDMKQMLNTPQLLIKAISHSPFHAL